MYFIVGLNALPCHRVHNINISLNVFLDLAITTDGTMTAWSVLHRQVFTVRQFTLGVSTNEFR